MTDRKKLKDYQGVPPLPEKIPPPPPKHMPEHWYRLYETECVLCWRGEKWRERVYGPRPEKYEDRYVFEQFLCSNHW